MQVNPTSSHHFPLEAETPSSTGASPKHFLQALIQASTPVPPLEGSRFTPVSDQRVTEIFQKTVSVNN